MKHAPQIPYIIGVDEVGRGPLAGPVVAAAVYLDPSRPITGLKDSKKLSEKRREHLAAVIRTHRFALGRAEVAEIDSLNILQASLLAMQRAVHALWQAYPEIIPAQPDTESCLVLVDGLHCPELPCACQAIVKGDDSEPSIAAASIVAKVARDQEMQAADAQFPQYGFAKHKGYPTKAHRQALQQHGPCVLHRRHFSGVKQ